MSIFSFPAFPHCYSELSRYWTLQAPDEALSFCWSPSWNLSHLVGLLLRIRSSFSGRTSCRGHRFRQALWLAEFRLGWALSFLWLAQTICVLYKKSLILFASVPWACKVPVFTKNVLLIHFDLIVFDLLQELYIESIFIFNDFEQNCKSDSKFPFHSSRFRFESKSRRESRVDSGSKAWFIEIFARARHESLLDTDIRDNLTPVTFN